MAHELEGIFAELGISQYLGIFLEQGFDTWETILDITESDLRIANSRGLAPDASLVSPTRATAEEPKPEAQRPEQPRPEVKDGPVVTKRKYRRHPKVRADSEPCLYTTKLVGEHWQNLTPGEKEPYESSALKAKEKYNHDLAEYKKTAEYRKYNLYLQDFKARQASANQEWQCECDTGQPQQYRQRQREPSGQRTTPKSEAASRICGVGVRISVLNGSSDANFAPPCHR
ncbi:HMG box protein [Colletotrichum higginsianum]|nr:HMG box protein [Colletotrichum higginsianum]